jgi:predicted enzyme related to lactoylglutathione lyase
MTIARTYPAGVTSWVDLEAGDDATLETAAHFYGGLFGWEVSDLGFARMIRQPGYGDHLAATTDPDIHERQTGVGVPPGFADAIGWVAGLGPDEAPHWHVTFTVADRDASVGAVERLGGSVIRAGESDWTRDALVADPWGARFTVSQFDPNS